MSGQHRLRVVATSVACSLLTATAVALAPTASAATEPDVQGTWALQQVTSSAQLTALTPAIEHALRTPGLHGFSLRVPWNVMDTDFSVLEQGRQLAAKHGLEYSVRFMAGRFSPTRIHAAGGASYVLPTGERTPSPFHADGSPNLAFEREYDAAVGKLASWSRANGVELLHLSWYAQDWAELNHGKEVRAAAGYSYSAWLGAHKRLIDIGLKHAGNGLAVEFPMSGYGPLVDASRELTAHIVSKGGKDNPHVYIQANGWGPTGDWGAPSSTVETQMDTAVWPQGVRRGQQAIQPEDYDWTTLYDTLRSNDAAYAEVYVPSFSAPRKDLLAAEIARFAAESEPPVPVADTTAPTAVPQLRLTDRTRRSVSVAWSAATDDVGVDHYVVKRNGATVARLTAAQLRAHTDSGLAPRTSYTYGVQAVDAAGNTSAGRWLTVRTR